MTTCGTFRPGHQFLANPTQRDIASQGGLASSGSFEPGSERAREAGRKGGSRTGTGSDDAE